MNEFDKRRINQSTLQGLNELGRQIPASVKNDLGRRLDAVINSGPANNRRTLLSDH